MKSTAETYFDASLEHLLLAQELHREGRYAPTHFFAGLAVECMLRACLLKETDAFESRHDIIASARESRFFDLVTARRSRRLWRKILCNK